jgi:hypothetical protein
VTRAAILVALLALVLTASVGAEPPVSTTAGNIQLQINGSILPKEASKRVRSPAALSIEGKITTLNGDHPPALKKLILDLDQNGLIDVRGLPTCSIRALQENGLTVCPEAMIGHGLSQFAIFPAAGGEGGAVPVADETVIFNGGIKNGVTRLLAYSWITVPSPAALIAQIQIRRIDEGHFGTRAVISIPEIVGSSGSLTSFRVKIDKKFVFQRKHKSVITFKCADGKARGHVEAVFADGSVADAGIVRRCIPKPGARTH